MVNRDVLGRNWSERKRKKRWLLEIILKFSEIKLVKTKQNKKTNTQKGHI